ncbi:hypothetical protein DFS33DRAFT_1270582 [Desarmillaria ectypa]|nr:hypothetical protein DFS33DRAFT_1270582 [Desarmillaria ectypa]
MARSPLLDSFDPFAVHPSPIHRSSYPKHPCHPNTIPSQHRPSPPPPSKVWSLVPSGPLYNQGHHLRRLARLTACPSFEIMEVISVAKHVIRGRHADEALHQIGADASANSFGSVYRGIEKWRGRKRTISVDLFFQEMRADLPYGSSPRQNTRGIPHRVQDGTN